MRDITFPRIMEEYLQGYREHYECIDPTVRLQENAVSKISRVKSFLTFMAHGFKRLSDWLFMRDLKRIRGWSRSLITSSLQVTTSDFYIKNIAHFVKYMSATPCKGSRLNQNDMTLITRELGAILKSLRKKVVIHQMQVKRDKMEGLPSHKDIIACLTAANTLIPQLLDVMASNPTTATRLLLYGYLTLHWSCIYGHRPGVYSNMTNAEVRKAETTGTAFGYLIHVSNHKTASAFGESAAIPHHRRVWMDEEVAGYKGDADMGEERVPDSAPTSPDTDIVTNAQASDQLANMQCVVQISPLVLDE
ncbi:uncharacterized protein LOC117549094 [Gymnodraco acuticeps]|uniref:Uncharacterized protein LOC117549094 n=1 Tax=Gymnodraco acuticeps TaxID=8218 RepID=A0A6P8UVU3_GYMAC|nr:uncharacterized protein LOC117549094 [Gymnodraco acuticeps]